VSFHVILGLVRARDAWGRDAGARDAGGVGLDVIAWLVRTRDSWGWDAWARDARGMCLYVVHPLFILPLLVSHVSSFQGDRISATRRSQCSRSSPVRFKNAIEVDILCP
jgi:hypothetical protein